VRIGIGITVMNIMFESMLVVSCSVLRIVDFSGHSVNTSQCEARYFKLTNR
jgi:hypothetical protein